MRAGRHLAPPWLAATACKILSEPSPPRRRGSSFALREGSTGPVVDQTPARHSLAHGALPRTRAGSSPLPFALLPTIAPHPLAPSFFRDSDQARRADVGTLPRRPIRSFRLRATPARPIYRQWGFISRAIAERPKKVQCARRDNSSRQPAQRDGMQVFQSRRQLLCCCFDFRKLTLDLASRGTLIIVGKQSVEVGRIANNPISCEIRIFLKVAEFLERRQCV